MDNAEEVMQLLEEFSKMKPKEIPRELDEYLGYVAKTGDPVYQWSLIKCLFREKLLNVITDFYESTPTIDLPPSPNVDPFNYERMKANLLERLDSFSNAPFTVQRICELLTNPRKEYNRADKFMRAVEKNVLVVSTRDPGPCRRVECDNQTDAVLNGIPETKLIDSQESIVNVCSYHSPVADTIPVASENDININVEQEEIEIDNTAEIISSSGNKNVSEDALSLNVEEVTLQYKAGTEEEEKNDSLTENSTLEQNTVEESSETNTNDNSEKFSNTQNENCDRTSNDTVGNNEAEETSSTCEEVVNFEISVVSIQSSEVQSEEEITESITAHNLNIESSEDNSCERSPDETGRESKKTEGVSEVSITEINNSNKLDDTNPEVNIRTVEFPPSSGLLSTEPESNNKCLLENDETPQDSSTSLFSEEKCLGENESVNNEVKVVEPASETIISSVNDTVASVIPKEEETISTIVSSPPSDDVIKAEMNREIVTETVSTEDVISSDDCVGVKKDKVSSALLVESTEEVLHMCEQDRREGSVIQSAPVNMATDTETVMEEISVDQTAEEETEAMDVDESSNQPMIVSEGENESEPMDQCDQPQS